MGVVKVNGTSSNGSSKTFISVVKPACLNKTKNEEYWKAWSSDSKGTVRVDCILCHSNLLNIHLYRETAVRSPSWLSAESQHENKIKRKLGSNAAQQSTNQLAKMKLCHWQTSRKFKTEPTVEGRQATGSVSLSDFNFTMNVDFPDPKNAAVQKERRDSRDCENGNQRCCLHRKLKSGYYQKGRQRRHEDYIKRKMEPQVIFANPKGMKTLKLLSSACWQP